MKKVVTNFLTTVMLLLFSAVLSPAMAENAVVESLPECSKQYLTKMKMLNKQSSESAIHALLSKKMEQKNVSDIPEGNIVTPSMISAEELDTIELVFNSFYKDPLYIPEEVVVSRNGDTVLVGGDWIFVLQNDRYQFTFDFYGGLPNDPSGTYTEKNLDESFSTAFFPGTDGKTSYMKTCNLTIATEKTGALTKYILDATVVTTLGIGGPENGAFKIHAEHKVVIADERYDLALYNCVLTPTEDGFGIAGTDDTLDVDLKFYTTEGIVGYYTHQLLDIDNSKFVHNGNAYEVMELEGIINTYPNIYDGVTYVAMMEIVANSATDTVFFNLAMEAPVMPIDTVDISCNNLYIDASMGFSQGTIIVTANNNKYSIYAGYNDKVVRDSATYEGTSTTGQAMAYITDLETEKVISAMTTKMTVVGSASVGYDIVAKVLGDDHVLYNLYLTNIIREVKDTVVIDFPTCSKSMYYIDEIVENMDELQLANYNEQYSVAFDILYINQIMGGEFTKDNLFIDQSYLVKHTAEGDVYVEMLKVDGTIKQERDTTFLTAIVSGIDSVLYHISMFYTVPTPTETLSYTFNENNTFFTNALPQGIFILEGMTDDGQVMSNVQVNRIRTGSAEGTFVNDGNFTENDFEPFNTFVSVWNPTINEFEPHFMQKGEMTVTIDDEGMLHAEASFICDDAKLYNLTFTVQFERPRLPYDAEEEGVEYAYGADAIIVTEDYVASDNLIFYDIYAPDFSNKTSLVFFIAEKDADIIIPEGVYPIDNSWNVGTALASRGLGAEDGVALPSYYVEMDENGYGIDGRGYFLVDGEVTVEKVNGKMRMTVDAINSYELPVKLHYDATQTAVENIPDNPSVTSIEKHLKDGQLLIIRNGAVYNASGARLK